MSILKIKDSQGVIHEIMSIKGEPTDIKQETGQSESAVMSQKAVTDELSARSNPVKYVSQSLTDAQKAVARDNINAAATDGYYEPLSVGLSDNLIDRKGTGTAQSFTFRTSCGDDSIADDGNGIIQSIHGKTIVWNQLCKKQDGQPFSVSSGGSLSYSDGLATFLASAPGQQVYKFGGKFNALANHKYIAVVEYKTLVATNDVKIRAFSTDYDGIATTNWQTVVTRIHSYTSTSGFSIGVVDRRESGFDEILVKDTIMVFDLTQMYGAGNEPTTVEDFRKDFPLPYYAYEPGKLLSFNGTGIKTVGFNQFDKDATYTLTFGSYRYVDIPIGKTNLLYMSLTDKDTSVDVSDISIGFAYHNVNIALASDQYNWVLNAGTIRSNHFNQSSVSQSAPLLPYVMIYPKTEDVFNRLTARYDICVNIVWSGYRNGEHEPYWSNTLALPIATYFPDGMKSAGDVYDELTKDKAVKRIGVVDLGTVDWIYETGSPNRFKTINLANTIKAVVNNSIKANVVCTKYDNYAWNTKPIDAKCVSVVSDGGVLIVDSAYTDTVAFKSAMSGVMLYYELAAPVETVIDPPLDLTYKVADFGTEELLPENGEEPTTTPFYGINKYSDDFTRKLATMSKNYQSQDSMDDLLTAVGLAVGGTFTKTWDSTNSKWTYTFTPNPEVTE